MAKSGLGVGDCRRCGLCRGSYRIMPFSLCSSRTEQFSKFSLRNRDKRAWKKKFMSNRNPGKGMVCARPSRTIPWDSTNSRMMDNAGVYAADNRFNILSAWSSLCTSRCTRVTCSSIKAARRLDSRRSSSRLATEEASRNPASKTWFRNVSSSRGKCRQGYGHALLSHPHPYLDVYHEMGRCARMLNKGLYGE